MERLAICHYSAFTHLSFRRAALVVSSCSILSVTQPAHAQINNCESLLTAFKFPNATITGAVSSNGGAYCAPDTWHLCFTNLPPSCQVTAQLTPTPDSDINVAVWMPMPGNNTQPYNSRYLGTGNGGYAGSYFYSELAQGINNGFATANTDMGTAGSVVPPKFSKSE